MKGANRARTAATVSASATEGCPARNGGSGSYSSASWIAFAVDSLESSAARRSPKSIPAVTPPPVTRLRSTTTRLRTGRAPNIGKRSMKAQWVAAS